MKLIVGFVAGFGAAMGLAWFNGLDVQPWDTPSRFS